jgi:hypothetical protein
MNNKYPTNLRNHPMVQAWVSTYKKGINRENKDCKTCGFPHSEQLLCGMGATFGTLTLGTDRYSVDTSNVEYFVQLCSAVGEDGFHWKRDIFFRRLDGCVVVTYYEKYGNTPRKRTWRIPVIEWESIVKSVSGPEAREER